MFCAPIICGCQLTRCIFLFSLPFCLYLTLVFFPLSLCAFFFSGYKSAHGTLWRHGVYLYYLCVWIFTQISLKHFYFLLWYLYCFYLLFFVVSDCFWCWIIIYDIDCGHSIYIEKFGFDYRWHFGNMFFFLFLEIGLKI